MLVSASLDRAFRNSEAQASADCGASYKKTANPAELPDELEFWLANLIFNTSFQVLSATSNQQEPKRRNCRKWIFSSTKVQRPPDANAFFPDPRDTSSPCFVTLLNHRNKDYVLGFPNKEFNPAEYGKNNVFGKTDDATIDGHSFSDCSSAALSSKCSTTASEYSFNDVAPSLEETKISGTDLVVKENSKQANGDNNDSDDSSSSSSSSSSD